MTFSVSLTPKKSPQLLANCQHGKGSLRTWLSAAWPPGPSRTPSQWPRCHPSERPHCAVTLPNELTALLLGAPREAYPDLNHLNVVMDLPKQTEKSYGVNDVKVVVYEDRMSKIADYVSIEPLHRRSESIGVEAAIVTANWRKNRPAQHRCRRRKE